MVNEEDYVEQLERACADLREALDSSLKEGKSDKLNKSIAEAIKQLTA